MTAEQAPQITNGTRLSVSGGGALYGVVYNAHYFVLIFYSQVLGLNAGLAGLAVGIGLVFDAITDPLVGYLSDNTRSKWGRRHPWLYASIPGDLVGWVHHSSIEKNWPIPDRE